MTTLHIEHAITDYEQWRSAFDRAAQLRTDGGVIAHRISQPFDDDRYIVVQLDFDDVARASTFLDTLRTRIWIDPARAPGLSGTPRAIILTSVEAAASELHPSDERRMSGRDTIGGTAPAALGPVRSRPMGGSDIEVIEAVYAAMTAVDLPRLFELIDEDCVITQDARLPWGGRHTGHDGLATFGLRLRESILSKVTPEAMFAADGDVIQFGRTVGTTVRTGSAFDIAEVHRWKVRNGRVVAAHFSIDTAAMLAALGDVDPTGHTTHGSMAPPDDS